MLQSSAMLKRSASIPCQNCKRRTQAGAPEHFQRKAPGAPLAGIDFGCNIQQIGQCNVPSAVAPFPYSGAPGGNGLRSGRQGSAREFCSRPRSVISTRKPQKKIKIQFIFAPLSRKFTVGGLWLVVWLGYGRSGSGIVTVESWAEKKRCSAERTL